MRATTTAHTTGVTIAATAKKKRLGDTRHREKTIGGMMMGTMRRKRTTRIVPLRGAILGPSGDNPRLVIVSGKTDRGKRYVV
jgi:hypothetical protein